MKRGAGPGAGIVLPRPSKGAGVTHRFAGGDGFFVPYIPEELLARAPTRARPSSWYWPVRR